MNDCFLLQQVTGQPLTTVPVILHQDIDQVYFMIVYFFILFTPIDH